MQRIFADRRPRHAAGIRPQGTDRRRRRTRSADGSRKARSTRATGPISRCSAPRRRPPAPNPIDAFIHDRLAREGLKPSPEADRRTLLRRVTLDLTGTAADARGERRVPRGQVRRTRTRRWSIACWPRRAMPSSRRCTGSTRSATPTPAASTATMPIPRLAVPRLRAARLPRQQAVRRVHARATRRRPAAGRDRRAAGRVGLQPSEPHVGRGRAAAQGVSREVRRRPRAHHGRPSGWAARWAAPSATTTSSIRSPLAISTR